MQIKLQHWLARKIIFLFSPLFIAAFPLVCLGQTELQPGQLAIVSVSTVEDPVTFEFVPFVDLEKGTVIHFTDGGFVTDPDSLARAEHILTYTAPKDFTAGAVIAYTEESDEHFSGEGLEAKGLTDNILVYQTSGGTEEPVFISGIEWGNVQNMSAYHSENQEKYRGDILPKSGEVKHIIISLDGESSFSYDGTYGTEGTAEMLLELITDEDHWRLSESDFQSFNNPFEVWNEPLIGFGDSLVRVTQSDSITVPVELIGETNNQNVSADIVFLPELSTVSSDAFSGFPVRTVTFSGSDTAGTVKAIHISTTTLPGLSAKEVAAFGLQNLTNASVITSKNVLRVEIEPSSAYDIIINEIYAGSENKAGGAGNLNEPNDEFIELVNRSNEEIDISKWSFSDNGTDVRHVFPSGTVLPPGGALVLLADASAYSEVGGGAIVQDANQYPELHLDVDGDIPTLYDTEGNIVDRYAYGPEAGEGESITRSPDLTGAFTVHTEAAGSDRLIFSPGTQIDGASFGSGQLIGFRGRDAWRSFAAPLATASFDDLLANFRTQGIPGSDEPSKEPSIYYWDEVEGIMTKPASMSDQMVTGRGYMFYYFNNSLRKTADSILGIPETIQIDNSHNINSFSVPVSATDANGNGFIDGNEGFNLLGNPFNKRISVSALLDVLEKVDQSINRNVLVWNHAAGEGNGAFQVLTESDFIAPFQAFFVRFMSEVNGTAVLNLNELLVPRNLYAGTTEDAFGFEIKLADEVYQDAYQLEFSEKGAVGLGRQDAFKLASLNPGSVNLYSEEGSSTLSRNALPVSLEGIVEIPLVFKGRAGEHKYRLSWESIGQIPEDWHFTLRDDALNREVDMRSSFDYVFMHRIEKNTEQPQDEALLYQDSTETGQSRFTLVVSPSDALASGQEVLTGSVKLNPNYPNPFNSATTIPFELSSETEVHLSIWNIVGQRVATLIDGAVFAAGTHEEPWNASDMPSGIYIAQLEVEGNVYIRKMTLIKN